MWARIVISSHTALVLQGCSSWSISEPTEARSWESPEVLRARLTTIRFGGGVLVWRGRTQRVLLVMELVLKDSSLLARASGLVNLATTELEGWPRQVWGMPRSAE